MSCNGSRLIHFPPPLYPLPRTHWLLHTAAGDPFTFHSQTHKHRRMGTHWTNCWRGVLHQTFCVSCYPRTTFINIIHHTQKLLHTSHCNVKHTQIQVLKAQWTPKKIVIIYSSNLERVLGPLTSVVFWPITTLFKMLFLFVSQKK